MSDETKMLSTAEAAEILGISVKRVQQLCKAGRIPAKRIGRDWVVLKAEYTRLWAGRPRKSDPKRK